MQEECTTGPTEYTNGKSARLDCDFKNFAMQNVRWYKDKKLLINGSQGLRQVSHQVSVDTFRSSLLFPIVRFYHTGSYTCKQEPAPPNSRCPNGKTKEIFVTCKCSSTGVGGVVISYPDLTLSCLGLGRSGYEIRSIPLASSLTQAFCLYSLKYCHLPPSGTFAQINLT